MLSTTAKLRQKFLDAERQKTPPRPPDWEVARCDAISLPRCPRSDDPLLPAAVAVMLEAARVEDEYATPTSKQGMLVLTLVSLD